MSIRRRTASTRATSSAGENGFPFPLFLGPIPVGVEGDPMLGRPVRSFIAEPLRDPLEGLSPPVAQSSEVSA